MCGIYLRISEKSSNESVKEFDRCVLEQLSLRGPDGVYTTEISTRVFFGFTRFFGFDGFAGFAGFCNMNIFYFATFSQFYYLDRYFISMISCK
jgi:hypothetical protein